MRIHITGASGSGTTTLGKALADQLGGVFLDADDYFWLPSNPPYRGQRHADERRTLLLQDMAGSPHAVVAGSVMAWGPALEDSFDLVVFLYLPTALRLARLQAREESRFGHAKPEFLAWAAQYDAGTAQGRSLRGHTDWLAQRQCPVLRLEGDLSTAERLQPILALCQPGRAAEG